MTLDQDTHAQCAECDTEFDTEGEGVFSEREGTYLCDSCYESEVEHASILYRFGDRVRNYLVSDYFINDENGDPALSGTTVTRKWVSTDGWRGYYVTEIKGYEVAVEGWTTGGWDDAVAIRKEVFNTWFSDTKTYWESNLQFPFGNFFVVLDRTSNVFSTAVTVLIPEGTREQFIDYIGRGQFSALEKSLS